MMEGYSAKLIQAVQALNKGDALPHLHPAMVAQWILESDRGYSLLAQTQNNFAGMKWRRELEGLATPKMIKVPSESTFVEFCDFATPELFVKGFYRFLDRTPYAGWRDSKTSAEYIEHIGKTWAADPAYVTKVKNLMTEAQSLIDTVSKAKEEVIDPTWFEMYKLGGGAVIVGYNGGKALWYMPIDKLSDVTNLHKLFGDHNLEVAPAGKNLPISLIQTIEKLKEIYAEPIQKAPGSKEPVAKPPVQWVRSPNFSARGGAKIDSIVLHYTTSRNINGSISWFQNPTSRVSAHYIVGRAGEIVQMVRDSDKAWHAAGFNDSTIGIEHVAKKGDKLTAEQEKSTINLCRWLMAEYRIPKAKVTGHRFLPNQTDCPGDLWPTEAILRAWVDKHLS